jgi:hypothetical protein
MTTTLPTTFRDTALAISPPWLRRGRAAKLIYSIATQLDVLTDATLAGIKMRYPGLYSYESLALIGRERRIRRGRTETNAVYATRLQRWLLDHQRRGGAYALLAQLHAHFAPAAFPIDLVYKSGRRYQMDVNGNVTRNTVVVRPTTQWARWTLYYWTDSFPDPISDEDRADLAVIPKEWIAAHCIGSVVIMRTGSELYDYHVPRRTYDGNHVKYDSFPAGTVVAIV